MVGYYRMYRGWRDNPVFRSETFSRADAWVWLIENAAWKDCRMKLNGHIVTINRGQLSYSVRYLGEAWKWSKSRVARFLDELKSEAMIETTDGTAQHVITICNYEKYQADQDDCGTPSGTHDGTDLGQQRDSSGTNKKKDKKDKKDIGGANAPPYAFVGRTIKLKPDDLDRWRKSYPNIADIIASLQAADDYYSEHPPPDGKWFFPVSNWLRKDNEAAAVRKKEATRGDDWW